MKNKTSLKEEMFDACMEAMKKRQFVSIEKHEKKTKTNQELKTKMN